MNNTHIFTKPEDTHIDTYVQIEVTTNKHIPIQTGIKRQMDLINYFQTNTNIIHKIRYKQMQISIYHGG